ncbi:hypothetical protein [Herbaspirillum sp. alder98]|uniref:hypothetical protein n=1 Tax=Herbaspirillum sp. alder98 TaxID=2913096 RepID=UPI001CD8BD1C|nr:hypothetical protein [Herbaspirillum sp. alder98]MCA1323283.1 hypothetical protein [Herbaspirillum sp. alder98]
MSASSFQVHRLAAKLALIGAVTLSLSACDYIGSFSKPKQTPEEAKAEGIALGAGCRQAGQSLEDCYTRNPEALKAGIFAGWKDMHEYMAAKNIQNSTPPAPPTPAPEAAKDSKDGAARDSSRARERERDSSRSRERESSSSSSSSRDSASSSSSRDSNRASRDEKPTPKY